ncbi:Mitochondrial distribution and morphology protein 10 like [Verticillium longisporum]|uniref:Mitochondrial distribution and morphology protein 10 n=1 Tax=Verticillium longisporum TaxID=100787 RepID=A0A8I3AM09_VERLO|nr:Mitochondrial distribution and morphology protein 10 like [Verticillium longisporum]
MAIGPIKAYLLAVIGMTLSNMAETLEPACGASLGVAAAEARVPSMNQMPIRGDAAHQQDEAEEPMHKPHDDRQQQQPLYTSETPAGEREPADKPVGRGGMHHLRMRAEKVACETESQWARLLRDVCSLLRDLSSMVCPLMPSKAFVWTIGILYLIARTPEAMAMFLSYLAVVMVERRLLFDFQGRYLGMEQAHRRAKVVLDLQSRMETAEKEAKESQEKVRILEMKLDRLRRIDGTTETGIQRRPKMREFMDYVRGAFYEATGWNRESSYSSLNSTADALLNFETPLGLRLTLSSLASPNFATSYQLGSVGVVDGSISYLYSSVPLRAYLTPQSERLPLSTLFQSYKPLPALPQRVSPDDLEPFDLTSPAAASLYYGRLYLPQSLLEALVIKRISPALQLQLSAVSGHYLRSGGTLLGLAHYDVGRYAVEGLASSDGGLLGLRGIYNFGGDAEETDAGGHLHAVTSTNTPATGSSSSSSSSSSSGGGGGGGGSSCSKDDAARERIYGRFSTGGEIYYGTLNKSGGMSVGARFATLPSHQGTPLTTTLTINPLMGNISATYAVMAGRHCSVATRFGFNVYSYESDWAVGLELWRKRVVRAAMDPALSAERLVRERSFRAKMEWRADDPLLPPEPVLVPVAKPARTGPRERSFEAKLAWRLDDDDPNNNHDGSKWGTKTTPQDDEYTGVIKARLDQNLRIGILWEGRAKSLLFSLGSGIDLRSLDSPFRTVGAEIQFSS